MPISQTLKTPLQIVVAIAAVAIVVAWIDLGEILEAAASANISLLAAAVLLMPINVWLEVLVWRPLVRVINPNQSMASLTRSVFSGFAMAIVTPARVGEFYGRTVEAPKGVKWAVGASVFVARIAELIVLGIVGILALFFFRKYVDGGDHLFWTGWLLAAASLWCFGMLAMFFVRGQRLEHLARGPLRKLIRPFRFLGNVSLNARLQTIAYAVLRYLVFAFQFYLCVRAFNIVADTVLVGTTIAVVFLVRALVPPVSFLDLGIREGAAAFVFGLVGMAEAAAFDAALAIFGINVLLPALIGIPLALNAVRSTNPANDTEDNA